MNRARRSLRFYWPVVAAGILAAPSVASAEGKVPYPGDLGQALAALAIFALLAWTLGKYAWKPILRQLRHREEDLQSKLDEAETRQAKAQELLEEYQEQLERLGSETQRMLDDAKKDARDAGQEILSTARDEAHDVALRSKEDLADARTETLLELRDKTAALAGDIARQVLGEDLTDAEHRRLVDDAVKRIAQTAGEESRS